MRRALQVLTPILVAAIVLLALAACSRYVSSYNALGLVRSNVPGAAMCRFAQLEGTIVFKLRSDDTGVLTYAARLGSGAVTVAMDDGDGKAELFSVGAGEEVAETSVAVSDGEVYVIVETDGTCGDGSFDFAIE